MGKNIHIGRLVQAVRNGHLKLDAIKDKIIREIVKRAIQ